MEAARVARTFGCLMVVDTTGGAAGGRAEEPDAIVRYYRQSVPTMRPLVISWALKLEMIQSLQLGIEQKRLLIPEELSQLRYQLSKYRWFRKGHRLFFSGPNDHEDDLVAALMMAYYGAICGWTPQKGGISAAFAGG
jgi:hypothetical protein